MRLRKIKNAKEKLTEHSDLVIFSPEQFQGKWHQLFENDNPIYLEIGMGKGKFISEHARKYPDINFIGCEKSDSIMLKAARNLKEFELKNLKFINVNASDLKNIFASNEISKIFLNFSDPWPKTRHSKRRLTSDEYLEIYQDILKKPGLIEMKTDNANLFEYSILKFNEFKLKFIDISLDLHQREDHEIITTEYEERFKSLNQAIYYIKVEV